MVMAWPGTVADIVPRSEPPIIHGAANPLLVCISIHPFFFVNTNLEQNLRLSPAHHIQVRYGVLVGWLLLLSFFAVMAIVSPLLMPLFLLSQAQPRSCILHSLFRPVLLPYPYPLST